MKSWIFAAAVSLAAMGAFASAASAEGPRASSENNWPGMMNESTPATSYPAGVAEGPRASSENNWPGMTEPAAAAYQATPGSTPHYVWQEGYSNHGRWVGHWVLVP